MTPQAAPDVSVVSSGHDVADARLHREVAALQRAGLTVEVLGLGVATGGPPGAAVRTVERGSMTARARRAVRLPFAAHGRVLLTLDPDVVPAALLAGRLRGRRVVADVHEDYVALLADRAWAGRARGLLQRLTAWCVALAGRADLTVVADDHVPPGPDRCRSRLVVRNLPDRSLLPPAPADLAADRPTPPLRAVYVGDVRASRGLRTMLDAVEAAPGWQLDLIGPVAPADADWLAARLLGDGLRDAQGRLRVRTHGRLAPREAWRVAAGAAVGLMLAEDTPAFRAAVPTKLYEYLASGMAVLATPLERMSQVLAGCAAAALVPDAAAAAAQLRAWADDPAALVAARRAAVEWTAATLPAASPWDELAHAVRGLISPPA